MVMVMKVTHAQTEFIRAHNIAKTSIFVTETVKNTLKNYVKFIKLIQELGLTKSIVLQTKFSMTDSRNVITPGT